MDLVRLLLQGKLGGMENVVPDGLMCASLEMKQVEDT